MEIGRHRLDQDGEAHYGPWRRAETTALVATSTAVGAWWARVRAWWRVGGRRGLLVAAFGVLLGLSGILTAGGDRALIHTLTASGIRTNAVVSGVTYGRGSIDSADVRFSVRGRQVAEELGSVNTMPDLLKQGQHVRVVYDPQDPAQVLLTSQMHNDPIPADYAMASIGGILAVVGIAWWAVRRRITPTIDQPEPK